MMQEKIEKIFSNFLDRNKEYVIYAYIRNGMTGNIIASLVIPIERTAKTKEKKYVLEWNNTNMEYNDLSIPYDEIMDCYEERDEYKSQTVVVILKNGMKIELECFGERM